MYQDCNNQSLEITTKQNEKSKFMGNKFVTDDPSCQQELNTR